MKYLLDTNAFLFAFFSPKMLSDKAATTVCNEKDIYVSIVSFWEIAIKQGLGKLEISKTPTELSTACEQQGIKTFPIEPHHLDRLKELPFIHRDPFDRLIIAQALAEDMTIVTKDSTFPRYEIPVVW